MAPITAKKMPRVSIGLPVYNGAAFLQESIESLLQQSYSDFELLISDNASTDHTPDICQTYARLDPRVRYFRNLENIGASENFNRVFRMSVGEYFKWATADDRSDAELVRACVEALDRQPDIVLAYGRTRFIDQAGNILAIQDPGWSLDSNLAHERFRRVLFAGHWVNCHYGVIRASTLTKTHLLPNYPGGDYRLLGELSIAGKFHEIPQNLFFRRIHPAASSQNGADRQWMQEFFGKHGSVATPHWRRSADHARSILRSNFSLGQKFSLSLSLLQAMRWRSIHLQRELRELILNFTFRHKHKSLPIARLIVSALLGLGEIGDSYGNFGSNV